MIVFFHCRIISLIEDLAKSEVEEDEEEEEQDVDVLPSVNPLLEKELGELIKAIQKKSEGILHHVNEALGIMGSCFALLFTFLGGCILALKQTVRRYLRRKLTLGDNSYLRKMLKSPSPTKPRVQKGTSVNSIGNENYYEFAQHTSTV